MRARAICVSNACCAFRETLSHYIRDRRWSGLFALWVTQSSLISAIDAYAADVGLAFQITDDILDVEGKAEQLGKTAGKDAASDKPTYISLFGLERSRALAAECIERALTTLSRVALTDGWLVPMANWILLRTS